MSMSMDLKERIFIFLSSVDSYHVHHMWDNFTCYAEIHFLFLCLWTLSYDLWREI